MYSLVVLSKAGRNMSLDDELGLILSVFDIIHLESLFPADPGTETDSVPTPGVSGSFLLFSHISGMCWEMVVVPKGKNTRKNYLCPCDVILKLN